MNQFYKLSFQWGQLIVVENWLKLKSTKCIPLAYLLWTLVLVLPVASITVKEHLGNAHHEELTAASHWKSLDE